MKLLVTGAFGNIGNNTIVNLIQQGHQVRCFDIKNEASEEAAAKFAGKIEMIWGDIRNAADVSAAVQDMDVVVHLAAIIPIESEINPDFAREVNVGGTQNVVSEMKKLSPAPKLIFASSTTVFGYTQDREPPLKITDPVNPTNNYTNHKVECEQIIQESGLTWCIMRFAAVTTIEFKPNPMLFYISLDSRMEFTHTRDASLAVANAASSDKVWGKILLIGGGARNQIRYRDYIHRSMDAAGVGRFPDEAFGSIPATPDWIDTSESQALLNYQHHTFDDWLNDRVASMGPKRDEIISQRDKIRKEMLDQSPYYKAAHEEKQQG
ncbi:MAG: NAD(P)-dependent oxidoreductase [Chloroflexota bacterium]|nr:NAD(P)-dependent oxidoreductase [Chloroflexota bacterium]